MTQSAPSSYHAALCRDCLTDHPPGPRAVRRCVACGSPRLLAHAERDTLSIAHVDCDAFYAAVEKRDNPELADKAVIIGGGKRGVVATACYLARTYGVRSAMPMFKALSACPDAVVIRPDMAKYAAVGGQIRRLMLELTPLVEPISIDEAFLDLTGTDRLHHASPALTLARFATRIEREIGISVSVGLSYAKFLAKVASDLDKPRGFSIIGRAEAVAFLSDKPVTLINGVGRSAADKLVAAGYRRIGDLRAAPLPHLIALAGSDGPRLQRLANGIDARKVTPERETKSVSAETTLDSDIGEFGLLEPILWRMSEKVSRALKRKGLAGRSLHLKLKTGDFRILTRSRQLSEPTQLAARMFAAGREMLERECRGHERYRLIGIGLSEFSDPATADHGDLADRETPRLVAVETAMDRLRAKFGDTAVVRGIGLGRDAARGPKVYPGAISRKPIAAEDPDGSSSP
jgi:DNA polymerase-4